jgi:hypothetical protein
MHFTRKARPGRNLPSQGTRGRWRLTYGRTIAAADENWKEMQAREIVLRP